MTLLLRVSGALDSLLGPGDSARLAEAHGEDPELDSDPSGRQGGTGGEVGGGGGEVEGGAWFTSGSPP